MKLKTLFRGLDVKIKGLKEIEIANLSSDSRIVAPGDLFIAKKGGADFIPQAIQAGAVAIVTDLFDPFCKIPQVITKNPDLLEPLLASRFFENPSKDLFVVGVTGTKGKTTTTYLIYHLLNALGKKTGLIGTVETILGEKRFPSTLTTHGIIYNQKILKEMKQQGCAAVSMEVSSHGLDQSRVELIDFDIALFTNLHADHLDYHTTLENYAEAKRKLFSKASKRIILNGDSPWADFMKKDVSKPVWTFGFDKNRDICAEEMVYTQTGMTLTVRFEDQKELFFLPLMGRFNVYNALGAIGIALHLGYKLATIANALKSFQTAPGRLERVENNREIFAFVDYAHTGEALENVLMTLKELPHQRLICVFGAGGNRDPQRRVQMAKSAEKYADISIITSDNPRKEVPEEICHQIYSAFQNKEKAKIEIDRKKAIEYACSIAQKQDILLIAGKGHEKVQIFSHQTIPFDDVEITRAILDANFSREF